MGGIFLGFDPGGLGRFGAALVSDSELLLQTVDSADEAFRWAKHHLRGRSPRAAGIDTLLHWSMSGGGWRPADHRLRTRHRVGVLAPNALRGAMVIGGMALAMCLQEEWSGILLNETHPKVQFETLFAERYRAETLSDAVTKFARRTRLKVATPVGEHEFDALISAWATARGLVWSLVRSRFERLRPDFPCRKARPLLLA